MLSHSVERNSTVSEPVCPELSIDKAQVLPSGDIAQGNTVNVTCLKPKRHVLLGSKEVTCQSTGWSCVPECRKCGESMFRKSLDLDYTIAVINQIIDLAIAYTLLY